MLVPSTTRQLEHPNLNSNTEYQINNTNKRFYRTDFNEYSVQLVQPITTFMNPKPSLIKTRDAPSPTPNAGQFYFYEQVFDEKFNRENFPRPKGRKQVKILNDKIGQNLLKAAQYGDVRYLESNKHLISICPLFHYENADGRTALHIASMNGHKLFVEKLLPYIVDIDKEDKYKKSASGLAFDCGHPHIFRLLRDTNKKRMLNDSTASNRT